MSWGISRIETPNIYDFLSFDCFFIICIRAEILIMRAGKFLNKVERLKSSKSDRGEESLGKETRLIGIMCVSLKFFNRQLI